MRWSVMRIDGQVPSPTPMVGMSGDSTRTTWTPDVLSARCSAAMALAVIQPAVPPPTITTFVVGRFITTSSRESLNAMPPARWNQGVDITEGRAGAQPSVRTCT